MIKAPCNAGPFAIDLMLILIRFNSVAALMPYKIKTAGTLIYSFFKEGIVQYPAFLLRRALQALNSIVINLMALTVCFV